MSEKKVILKSKIDITLSIPAKMRGIFPNKKSMEVKLKAGDNLVPEYIADYYSESRPHVFSKVYDVGEEIEGTPEIPGQPEPEIPEEPLPPVTEFDPVEFLERNYEHIETALEDIGRNDLVKLAKFLKLSKAPNREKSKTLVNKIIHDIKVKQKQAKELSEHKEADEEI